MKSAIAESEVAAPFAAEHRGSPRRRVLKGALIVFKQGHCTMRCKVTNLSDSGAVLEPTDVGLCPSEFVLKFDVGPPRSCEVVWRSAPTLAVRFLSDTVPMAPFDDTVSVRAIAPATNPSSLREAFDQSVFANQGDSRRGALLVICISNLQLIKAAYGEEPAKTVFGVVERKLQEVLRGLDVMGRLSDDRIGIVLSGCRPEHVASVAKRFLAAAGAGPVVVRDGAIEVLLSTSILVPEKNATLSELIAQAEPSLARPIPGLSPAPAPNPVTVANGGTKQPLILYGRSRTGSVTRDWSWT